MAAWVSSLSSPPTSTHMESHCVLVRVDDNEQGVAPFPRVVVLAEVVAGNRCQGVVIPGVESVGDRVGVVPLARIDAQKGLAVRIIEIPALFVLVISRGQKNRQPNG